VYQILLAVFPIILLLVGMLVLVPLVVLAALASDSAGAGVGAVVAIVAVVGVLLLAVMEIGGFIYALVGAYETYHGRHFRYPVVGRMMDRT
jgi:uncharacterized Tic20 family protein